MVTKIAKRLLLSYFIYCLVTGVLFFAFFKPVSTIDTRSDESLFPTSLQTHDERVVLIEDGTDALRIRLDLINSAQETLDITYYSMQGGDTVELFYASLIEAANRGVSVRFLIDGFFHHISRTDRHLLTSHPNISVAFYEPFNWRKPWTWHNRLHDKFMIADQQKALIGGRNIGDKYFGLPSGQKETSYDRDVLIINKGDNGGKNVIRQMSSYYNALWLHEFTNIQQPRRVSSRRDSKIKERYHQLLQTYQHYQSTEPELFEHEINWLERSHPVEQIYFVHNSIDRGYKQPYIWHELLTLANQANESLLIQSPYIIPSKPMRQALREVDFLTEDAFLLTNGLAASPNVMAHSGYRNHRQRLIDLPVHLYEYLGPDRSLHTKSMVIDQRTSVIGSFNIDARSTYLNTESVVIIDSPELAEEIHDIVANRYLANSVKVDEVKSKTNETNVSFFKHLIVFVLRGVAKGIEFLI